MDVNAIKEYLYDNQDELIKLLKSLDFVDFSEDNTEIRCAKEEGANSTSVRVKKNRNITANIFSEGISGDIITLVSEWKGLEFRETLDYICNTLGLKRSQVKRKEIVLPFGGFCKKFDRNGICINEDYIEPIDESFLNRFVFKPNLMFYKDGISIKTQKKFSIGYDYSTHRIAIPWHDHHGNLVGVMGRINESNYDGDYKYLPIGQGFEKNKVVYGYTQNYNSIKKERILFIGEAEKFVMQLDSMGIELGLGLGGNEIQESRAKIINSLNADILIVAFDEGLSEEHNKKMAERLIMNNMFYKNKVGYIYDRDNKYMKKGSHVSPTDMGKDVFDKLVSEYTVWVN